MSILSGLLRRLDLAELILTTPDFLTGPHQPADTKNAQLMYNTHIINSLCPPLYFNEKMKRR